MLKIVLPRRGIGPQLNLEENVFASPRRRRARQINPDDDGGAGLSQHSATVALRLSGPLDVAFLKQRARSLVPGSKRLNFSALR